MVAQEILIGRDAKSQTLKITSGDKSITHGSVPQTVSREHCKILRNPDGSATITNLNPNNHTYVNGKSIYSEKLTADDIVELGADHYRLDTSFLKLSKTVDISHLKTVWDNYRHEEEHERIKSIRANALRSITGLFSMGAIIISFGDFGMKSSQIITLRLTLYTCAVATLVWSAIYTFVTAPRKVREATERKQDFTDNYVCPSCNRFLGESMRYERLISNGECPMCHTKYYDKNQHFIH